MRIVKEATERKNEILDAAAVLFMKKGFDNTSTNDILEAVGIARGTLYHHFKSKEEVMDALIDRQMEKILSAARQAAADLSVPDQNKFPGLFIPRRRRLHGRLKKPEQRLLRHFFLQKAPAGTPP